MKFLPEFAELFRHVQERRIQNGRGSGKGVQAMEKGTPLSRKAHKGYKDTIASYYYTMLTDTCRC